MTFYNDNNDIIINGIQPFETGSISAAFFLCRPMMKHYRSHKFINKFQDDIQSVPYHIRLSPIFNTKIYP